MMKFFLSLLLLLFTFPAFASFSDQDQIPLWATQPLQRLVDQGIFSGNDDGSFAPDRPMNRAEFSKLMVTATKSSLHIPTISTFPDVSSSEWFFPFVETAKHYGWISGYPDGTFNPAGLINRAEVAKILAIAFDLFIPNMDPEESWSDPYFRALNQENLLAYGTTMQDLGAAQNPTRAEIAHQIDRFMTYALTQKDTQESEKDAQDLSSSDTSYMEMEIHTPENPVSDSSTTQTQTDNEMYEYRDTLEGTLEINPSAGMIYIDKYPDLPRELRVSKGQKDVVLHKFTMKAENGLTHLAGFTFRRMGQGSANFFERIWLELEDQPITEKLPLTQDVITLPLKSVETLARTEKTFTLKADMAIVPTSDKGSRFVLYRPDWIDADTDKKIGFFPIGGIDIYFR